MPAKNVVPVRVYLPPGWVEDLDKVAKSLGWSRSALMCELLTAPISKLAWYLSDADELELEVPARRLRGASKVALEQEVKSALRKASRNRVQAR